MKKSLLLLMFTCFLSVIDTTGQGRGDRGPSPEYLSMIDSLYLDTDQKVQLDVIEKIYVDKRRSVMIAARDSGQDRKTVRGEIEKIENEKLMVLGNLFTEEQFKQYSDFMKKQQQKRANRREARGGRKGGRGQNGSGRRGGTGGLL